MRHLFVCGATLLFVLLFTVIGYSEVTLSQSGQQLKAIGADGTSTLDATTKEGVVTDLNGGKATVSYDAASGATDVKAVDNTVGFTYSIAKIYVDAGESARISQTAGFGGFSILNTSDTGDILAIFPDMSKISMPTGSQVSFMKLADGGYYMKVDSGSVLYTDPDGNTRTLTTSTPPMYVKGFENEPGWRSDELVQSNPATP